jgi:hypothetical protein
LETRVPLKIVERKPIRPLGGAVRRLSVSVEVADLLDGHTAFGNFPAVEAEKMIGIFCAGQYITISRRKNKVRPDLERLEGFDEVWSFCLRRPVPGWRLLGRFYQKDHLVLVRGWDKHKLFKQYNMAAEQVINDWKVLTGTDAAHSGDWYSGYLSGVIRDVDEPF